MSRKHVGRNGRKYIELEPGCIYGIPLENGYLDIRVSQDPDYPGLDVEYISDNPHPEALPNPRVTIETPYDVDTGGYNLLRALIWTYRKSKKYTYEIELTKEL